MRWHLSAAMVSLAFVAQARGDGLESTPPGTARVWQPVVLTFRGPKATQTSRDPNPFLDYRLQVQFTGPAGRLLDVPGYFDGDGGGGPEGDRWRVRFLPPAPGHWRYHVSFRRGPGVAVDLDRTAGEAVAPDGALGSFEVAERDPAAPGFWRWGLLSYAGRHYLRFQDGPYWLKGGCDEPENFLAYAGFVNTPPSHTYAAHADDWRDGDPDWDNGKGRAIIGALNYLASKHVNSIYFLTMNLGGDGRDVWPWAGAPERRGSPNNDNLHFDLAKLAQWEIVLAHAQRKGIVLHFVLDEAEAANKRELDDGALGPERKLYYRELVARFAHHPGLQWNLCEEYNIGGLNLGAGAVRQFASYLRAVDPYDHPITVHSAGDPLKALAFTFGDPLFDLTSVQLGQKRIDLVTEAIREATAKAGRPLPAAMDEFTVDKGTNKPHIPVDDAELQRKQKLWPTYLSGGSIEFILEGLLRADSFKTPAREALWDFTWYARDFLEELPFWAMTPADHLSRGAATFTIGIGGGKTSELPAQVFAKPGGVYAVYFPRARLTGELDLSEAPGEFILRWYDPRNGRFAGEPRRVEGGRWVPLGPPPSNEEDDWALVARLAERPLTAGPRVFPGRSWATRTPEELGLRAKALDDLAQALGGRGCVVKDGYVIKTWGPQDQKSDWFSAAKPVLSTLLLFALEEGKVTSVDQPIAEFGWNLRPKDQGMTFRHLASMTSGYARPERPGEAWSYNDYAIMLYQKTLFDRVFQGDPDAVANAPERFGALGLEDGLSFRRSNRRLSASVRDFARVAWFWLERGAWNGRQLLPRADFEAFVRPQVPKDLPLTRPQDTDDYLGIGTYGGGSDHFSRCGPGIYGLNFWYNRTGRDHPDRPTWPGVPDDTFFAAGARGNCAAMIPSLGATLVAAEADWGGLVAGNPRSKITRNLRAFADAVTPGR